MPLAEVYQKSLTADLSFIFFQTLSPFPRGSSGQRGQGGIDRIKATK